MVARLRSVEDLEWVHEVGLRQYEVLVRDEMRSFSSTAWTRGGCQNCTARNRMLILKMTPQRIEHLMLVLIEHARYCTVKPQAIVKGKACTFADGAHWDQQAKQPTVPIREDLIPRLTEPEGRRYLKVVK